MKDLVPQQQQEIYITSSVEVRIAVIENTLQNINETLKLFKSNVDARFDKVDQKIDNLRLEIKSDIKSLNSRLWYLYSAVGTSFFILLGVIARAMKWIGS